MKLKRKIAIIVAMVMVLTAATAMSALAATQPSLTGPETAQVGDTLTFTVTVNNRILYGVASVTSNLTIVGNSSSDNPSEFVHAGGAGATVTYTVSVTAAGPYAFTLLAQGGDGGEAPQEWNLMVAGTATAAGATDPTDPTDPGADPTDPGTDPTDPGTDPTTPPSGGNGGGGGGGGGGGTAGQQDDVPKTGDTSTGNGLMAALIIFGALTLAAASTAGVTLYKKVKSR